MLTDPKGELKVNNVLVTGTRTLFLIVYQKQILPKIVYVKKVIHSNKNEDNLGDLD